MRSLPDKEVPGADRSREALVRLFTRTAEVLERSAVLAEEHAAACDRAGQLDVAEQERRAARRARHGARRARSRADQFLGRKPDVAKG